MPETVLDGTVVSDGAGRFPVVGRAPPAGRYGRPRRGMVFKGGRREHTSVRRSRSRRNGGRRPFQRERFQSGSAFGSGVTASDVVRGCTALLDGLLPKRVASDAGHGGES